MTQMQDNEHASVVHFPGGWNGRRGSVLLMVVGVLALMAIIAVVYAAIAQADRRGSSAFVRANQIDDQVDLIRDYLATVIAEDRTSTYRESMTVAGGAPFVITRKTWDFPGVDPLARSEAAPTDPARFRPVGGAYSPWLASTEPTRIGPIPAGNDPQRPYLSARDWLSISNIVPDGRFVNLATLRNNFRAEPGTGADGRGKRRMSEGLTLFDANGRPYSTTGTVQLDDGTPADPNIPAHWTMRQRHAFRPAMELDRRAGAPDPGADEYLLNQWADADGDGMIDSRWFELLDASDPFGIRALLPQDPKIRFFIACRIVDQSGKVNVNTATDLLRDPSAQYPLGTSPADVDLRRVLDMTSAFNRYGRGYDFIQQPTPAYPALSSTYTLNDGAAAAAVGHSAYAALRDSLITGTMPSPGSVRVYTDEGVRDSSAMISARARSDYYAAVASDPNGRFVTSLIPNTTTRTTGMATYGPIGIQSDLELLTFGGANDPRRMSDLETILDGRNNALTRFGVLRSNRDQTVERGLKDNNAVAYDGLADEDALLLSAVNVRNQLTTHSGAAPLTSLPSLELGAIDPIKLSNDEVKVDYVKLLKYPQSHDLTNTTGRMTDADRKAFFMAMLDALMPYRHVPGVPTSNTWNTANAISRSLNYGRSAEFAYRSTIHSFLNTLDAMDDDDDRDLSVAGPTAISVRLSQAPFADRQRFPWKEVTLSDANEMMQLPATGALLKGADQINMFGIEAQPFLVEAAYYAVFVDMPPAAVSGASPSGDDEYANANPDPNMPIVYDPITIRHDRNSGNSDYVGEVLAFQITNPFDRELELDRGGSNSDGMLYYVEYAGNAYRLGGFDQTTRVFSREKLRGGETKVYYVLSWPKNQIEKRIDRARTRLPGNIPAPYDFNNWLNVQFGPASTQTAGMPGRNGRVEITMVDPKEGTPIAAPMSGVVSGVLDLQNANQTRRFGSGAAGEQFDPKLRESVMLWRVMRSHDPSMNPPGPLPPTGSVSDPVGGNNIISNDLLVDRMHDPLDASGNPSLYINLAGITDDDVAGTEAGPDRTADVRDNTGFAVTFWGSVRRPNNPDNIADHAPAGAMPPWCLEAKNDQFYTFGQLIHNEPTKVDEPASLGSRGDYSTGGGMMNPRYRTAQDMIDDAARIDDLSLPTEIRSLPKDKKGNNIPASQSRTAAGQLPYSKVAVELVLGGNDKDGRPRNPGLFKRTGDLLLPLAIGPYQEANRGVGGPTGPGAANAYERLEQQWMSLSEVLALCSDYYSPTLLNNVDLPRHENLYYLACHVAPIAPGAPSEAKLDRGHFVLDDFVPYIETVAGSTGPGADSYTYGSGDRTVGLGVPLALNLFSKFRATSFGSKSELVEGQMNINSVGVAASDSLALLTPDYSVGTVTIGADMLPAWLTTDVPAGATGPGRVNICGFTAPAMPQTWDVSTTLRAYRDKTELTYRDFLGTGPFVSFRTNTALPADNPLRYGRRLNGYIDGLREEPGFRSLGEIMAARLRSNTGAVLTDDNGIDRLGNDGVAIKGYPGVASTSMVWDRDGDGVITANDQVNASYVYINTGSPDSFDQKLALANAVAGSADVRSDVFAVWFLVHGYLEADTQGLGSEDPMVPTFARRYVMVIDRSNVVQKGDAGRKGDKPRVLLFQEVPL